MHVRPTPIAIRPAQAAEMLGISRSNLYALVAAGKIPQPRRIGQSPRFDVEELRLWVAAGSPSMDIWREKRKVHGFEG